MTRYVWHGGQWYPMARHAPLPSRAPYIISDHMQPLRHPVTGDMLDSKSAFRALTKANGYVEMGNDAPMTSPGATDPKDVQADIIEALHMHEQGYQPEPLERAAPDARIYETPDT